MKPLSPLQKAWEFFVEKLILLCGLMCIVFVILLFGFLLKEGLSIFRHVMPWTFIGGSAWHPVSKPPQFGILTLILGSFAVTFGAAIISVPFGLASAVYISEVAPPKIKEYLKIGIELIAAIPSVVIGFIGMVVLAPIVARVFHLESGLTAFTASLMLALMAMPTTVSIAEDAISGVPRQYKEAALALGATHWQTIYRVILRAAAPGLLAAVMLGIGRVIGETMAVMMLTGNSSQIPHTLLQPVRTLTATIASEMGETMRGSDHYSALFAIGIVLFVISFVINFLADMFLHRSEARRQ